MHLKHIIDLAQQLHPVSIFRDLQTGFLQVFLDAELSAIIQLLPELTAVVCGDTQLLIDYNTGDSLLLTGCCIRVFCSFSKKPIFFSSSLTNRITSAGSKSPEKVMSSQYRV